MALKDVLVQIKGDPSGLNRALSQAGAKLGAFDKQASKLGGVLGAFGGGFGGALASAIGGGALVALGADMIQTFSEAEAVWNRLAGTLRNAGVDFATVRGEIEQTARTMQDATTVGDEDFAAVLQALVSITNDYAGSLKNVALVADLAAAKGLSLDAAAQLVGKAMTGQTSTLKRYGIVVAEGTDAIEVMRERFQGMAENEARTLQGQFAQINNELGDFKEAVGGAMAATADGTSILTELRDMLKDAALWTTANTAGIAKWGRVALAVVKAVGESFRFVFRLITRAGFAVGAAIGGVFVGILLGIQRTINRAIQNINELIGWANKLPGVQIAAIGTLDAAIARSEKAAARVGQAFRIAADGIAEGVYDIGKAYRGVADALNAPAAAALSPSRPAADTNAGGTGGGDKTKTKKADPLKEYLKGHDGINVDLTLAGADPERFQRGQEDKLAQAAVALQAAADQYFRESAEAAADGPAAGSSVSGLSGGVFDAFDMVKESALSVVGGFSPLAMLSTVLGAAMEPLAPILEILQMPLKALGNVVGKVLVPPLKALAYAIGWVIRGLGKLLNAIPDGRDMGAGLVRAGQEMIDAVGGKMADAADGASKSLNQLTSSLTNVPQILKTYQLAGASAVATAAGIAPRTAPVSQTNTFHFNVQAAPGEDGAGLLRKLRAEIQRRAGASGTLSQDLLRALPA